MLYMLLINFELTGRFNQFAKVLLSVLYLNFRFLALIMDL